MKVWYQVLSALDKMPQFAQALQARLDELAGPGFTYELHGTSRGGLGNQFRFFHSLEERDVIDSVIALRGSTEYAALAIGQTMEPAMMEAREVLDIPVLGHLETACVMACLMGEKFGAVSPNIRYTERVESQIRGYGLAGRFVHGSAMAFHVPDLDFTFSDVELRDRAVHEFTVAGRECVDRGAEVIVCAGGLLPVFLNHWKLPWEVEGALVLDSVAALVHMTEMAVRMQQTTGQLRSRKLTYSKPDERIWEEAKRRYSW